jgi:hypothetical protein
MLIRVKETIVFDDEAWAFDRWGNEEAAAQAWAAALKQAYADFLHARFPAATLEITIKVGTAGRPGLSLVVHGTASDPTLVGLDDRTLDALHDALVLVASATWDVWEVTHSKE